MAAWGAARSEGVWKYAGVITPKGALMICTGLDQAAAATLADPSGMLDPEALRIALSGIEEGRLQGQAKLSEKDAHEQ